jgi:hypothetical protein
MEKRNEEQGHHLVTIGQALWLKGLEIYINFPPLQNRPDHLEQVVQ